MNIKWQALEFEHKPKSPDWFWALWIISVGTIVASVMSGSMLFAILVFIIAFTLSLQAVRKPEMIDFEINPTGIVVGKTKYPYKNLESFCVHKEENPPKIILKTKSALMPFVVLPLGQADEYEVEESLLKYIEKEEHEEPFIHKITKYF